MAKRKNQIGIDTSQLEDLIEKFDALPEEMEKGAEIVLLRTYDMMQPELENATVKAAYPAKGKYSEGTLEQSMIRGRKVIKNGVYLELPFGFDKDKAAYSHYLITGTPKMKKSKKLWTVFHSKTQIGKLRDFQMKVMWSYFAYVTSKRKGG